MLSKEDVKIPTADQKLGLTDLFLSENLGQDQIPVSPEVEYEATSRLKTFTQDKVESVAWETAIDALRSRLPHFNGLIRRNALCLLSPYIFRLGFNRESRITSIPLSCLIIVGLASGRYLFLTVNLLQRQGNDLLIRHVNLLRETVRMVRQRHSFIIHGWVVLPEHLHCVIELPPNDSDFATRWRLIKIVFSKALPITHYRAALEGSNGAR